ncbi:MAG TPA: ATP-dependent DNA helicase [Nocardioidaceae bacterium]|nr:ATP-dependent DNA helicase [Nocardioidaceae bacterium]
MPMTYQLRRSTGATSAPPRLDAFQQAVVDHRDGPLLVLAGPGTGKTTTVVEAVAARVEQGDLRPEQALVLTFSRKAAEELRTRITRRLGRTTAAPTATTFHSFCYALVRRFSDPESYADPVQLLSAPEQDVRLRELLAGSVAERLTEWPPFLRAAVGTRGLAEQLRLLTDRARALGMDPEDLAALGAGVGRADWVAAGHFMEDYLTNLDQQGSISYAELVHRARLIARMEQHRDVLRAEFPFVVVDEYQDTDPTQVSLLQALVGGRGGSIMAVGDPDQSIYAFRGADVSGLWRFPTDFTHADGTTARVLALGATRRFGPVLAAASRHVLGSTGARGSVSRSVFETFRQPQCVDPPYGDGEVQVRTFGSAAAEAEHIADLLRRAHLDDGIPWSQMAVLVRTSARLPRLQRALIAAGVPVEVAGDEVPLRSQPAVRALLTALRVALRLAQRAAPPEVGIVAAASDGESTPALPELAPDEAEALLLGPLGGLDPAGLRRLAARLRRDDRNGPGGPRPPRPSDLLLAAALAEPAVLRTTKGPEAAHALGLAELLHRAGEALSRQVSAEEVLWMLWSGTSWPDRLSSAVDRGGAAARRAHRDLDAVCALFDQAARVEERQQRRGAAGLLAELEAQEIPAQPIGEQSVRPESVRLLTVHRAKGLEWRLVVVAGVQEGEWPDLRWRGSILDADRLQADGLAPRASTASLLAEERRLFYVAVTRARQRLVVTAVASVAEDGDQPSRFAGLLGVDVGAPEPRPRRPLSLVALTAELRALAERGSTPRIRSEAARRLAGLAQLQTRDGRALVPAASPARWWGLAELSSATVPVRPDEAPLRLSGSALESLTTCPLRWFLDREAGAAAVSTAAQGFGSVLHALAEAVAQGSIAADERVLSAQLDEVWDRLDFAAPWVAERERAEAIAAINRFLAWTRADRGRSLLGAEVAFEVQVEVDVELNAAVDVAAAAESPTSCPEPERVVLRGSMDRVEIADDGRVYVVDFKTGRSCPTRAQVDASPQLGAYQLAVRHGAVDDLTEQPVQVGGAELVQLRNSAPGGKGVDGVGDLPRVQRQRAADARPEGVLPIEGHLREAVRTLRLEDFAATRGPACRTCDFVRACPAQPHGRTVLSPRADVRAVDEEDE